MCRTTTGRSRSLAALCAAVLAAGPSFAQEPEPAVEPTQSQTEAGLVGYIDTLRQARDSLINARDFEAALGPAEIVVKEIETAGATDYADQIILAYVLAELKRFEEAEQIYFRTIQEIGEAQGEFSESLVLPLRLLGRSYIGGRMFPEAITVLQEAQHVSQRNEGLFNIEQAGLLDDMTTAYLGMGDTLTARDLQVERLRIAQRRFGPSDPQVIPFHQHLADYYERSRLRTSARGQYEAVLEILEARSDTKPSDLLEPLRSIARIDMMSGTRREALDRIDSIVTTATDLDPHEMGLSLAVLGDSQILADEPAAAGEYYARAYELLGRASADPDARFSEPSIVRFVPPLYPVDRGARSLPYAWGTIAIEFDVDADGKVTAINRVGAEPANGITDDYVERLRQAYFRPRLVAGRPAATEGVRLTHYFRYYVDKDEDSEADE
jgi:tetratricopeptide (TPR) repeat protein